MEPDDFNEHELFGEKAIAQVARVEPLVDPRPAPAIPANTNPLAGYFRAPGIHVKLPTGGAFLPVADYEPTLAGDLPVYPMTTGDELLLKSPDALMSGHAIVSLIKSCVPAIRNPGQISTPDLDVLLLAIRAATYGEMMDIDVNCPSCGAQNGFQVNLGAVMGTMVKIDPQNPVRLTDDVVAYVRPYTLALATKVALSTFDEARKMQAADDLEDGEERSKIINDCYDRLNELNKRAIVSSIQSIVVPGSTVTDPKYIGEFVANTDRGWIAKIEEKLKELNAKGIDKTIDAHCESCSHEWKAAIEFDPSTFFATGS